MQAHLGLYYRLGGLFSALIGQAGGDEVRHPAWFAPQGLMYLVLKLLAGLYDSRDGDWADRMVRGLAGRRPVS